MLRRVLNGAGIWLAGAKLLEGIEERGEFVGGRTAAEREWPEAQQFCRMRADIGDVQPATSGTLVERQVDDGGARDFENPVRRQQEMLKKNQAMWRQSQYARLHK